MNKFDSNLLSAMMYGSIPRMTHLWFYFNKQGELRRVINAGPDLKIVSEVDRPA